MRITSNNMFLSSCLILVPMIFATIRDFRIEDYVVYIDYSNFKSLLSIDIIGDPSKELPLSGLGLEQIYDNTFENVTQIQILNLSNNLLSVLQENIFVNLTNLEQLNLSYNNIIKFNKTFVGLINLKVLDLSNNKITKLQASDFFGITIAFVILLKGNINIHNISTEVFENKSYTKNSFKVNDIQVEDTRRVSNNYTNHFGTAKQLYTKICINDTKLISIEYYTQDEKLASGCNKLISHAEGILFLGFLQITEFQKGWYKLQNLSIYQIHFISNNITRLTSEMLNDLPESISIVNLKYNNIKRLNKGVIVNEHLREISLTGNSIIEIEDDVFINTNLTTLILSKNQLTDTKFAATFPPTLTKIKLDHNRIAEISPGSFSKLNKLKVLMLNDNDIMEIYKDSLRGLSGLKSLSLARNKLIKIEAICIKTLTALEVLNLKSNNITEMGPSVFADLESIKKIFLGSNSLRNLTNSLNDLPDSLEVLDLQSNMLKNLKAGLFVNSPKYELLLSKNRIENIEAGSFNLPFLQILNLTGNLLSVIDSGMLKGFRNLKSLRLDYNYIGSIEEGAFKNLGSLCKLVISHNPIERLEYGTLYGLLHETGCYIEVKNVPIEMTHGGIFASSVNSSSDFLSKNYTQK